MFYLFILSCVPLHSTTSSRFSLLLFMTHDTIDVYTAPAFCFSSHCCGVRHLSVMAWMLSNSLANAAFTARCRCNKPLPSNCWETVTTSNLAPQPSERSVASTWVASKVALSLLSIWAGVMTVVLVSLSAMGRVGFVINLMERL